MQWDLAGMFLIASVGLTIAPGPDNLFVLAQGINHRRALALAAAWGMASGVIVHTSLAAFGISAVIYSSTWAFNLLKIAGSGYLLYLSVLTFLSRNEAFEISTGSRFEKSRSSMYRRGFLMNMLNPKVGVFFLAFLPQFVSPESGNVPLQMLVLGFIFMAQAFLIFSLIAWFSSAIGKLLARNREMKKGLTITTSIIFLLLGLKLIFEKAGA